MEELAAKTLNHGVGVALLVAEAVVQVLVEGRAESALVLDGKDEPGRVASEIHEVEGLLLLVLSEGVNEDFLPVISKAVLAKGCVGSEVSNLEAGVETTSP